MTFDLADLDVPTYLDFVPTKLNFRIAKAKLGMHLVVAFKAAAKTADGKTAPQSLALSGHVGLADLSIADLGGRELIAAKSMATDITRLAPLTSDVQLANVAIVEPRIALTREQDGSIDLVKVFAPAPATDATPPPPAEPASAAPKPGLSIATATIKGGSVTLIDRTLGGEPLTTAFDGIEVKLDKVTLAGAGPAAFDVSVKTPNDGTIAVKGTVAIAERKVDGTFQLRHFQPGAFSRYLAAFLAARIGDGTVDADAHYAIDASGAALAGHVDGISANVVKLRSELPNEKSAFVAADAIALEGGSYDFPTHTFEAEKLAITAPTIAIKRDAKGRFNLQAALVESKAPQHPAAKPEPAVVVAPADAKPFVARIRTFSIARGDVSFDDVQPATPVKLRIAPLDVQVENVGTATDVTLPFRIAATIDKRGKLAVQGKVTPAPLALEANVDASNLPVGWAAAYAGDKLNVVLTSADFNAKGALRVVTPKAARGAAPQTPHVSYRGSLGIARMRALDRLTSEEFVSWKSLAIPHVDFFMPAHNAPLAINLGPVALDDFYARIIVNANGRLNLQDVVAAPGQVQSVTTPEDGAPAPETPAPPPPPAPNVAQASVEPAGPKPQVRLQGVKLTNGRIGITDNFVRPNYSANLSDLVGEISAVSSDQPAPADLKLDGKIDGDGVLTVSGKVNPFGAQLYTDIAADAKDIELTRLTPYAIKYAGYGIQRGKLSTTLKYHIENGKLEAQNHIFLNQLTFGEHDPSSKANLPVRLAVALLSNSKGEIDIDLPVSGTLSDPQFSIGGVLWRAFVNLVVRAVTSPFALIGSAFGGGSGGELGYIQFQPGVSDLAPMGKQKLETLAKALTEKGALKLDIIGRFDPATDPEGIKKDHLLDRMKDIKAKEQSKGGERVGRSDVKIEPGAEYEKYLAQVYDDTKLPDKPRNVVGLAKSIPPADMERLLLANMKLDANDPLWLAQARADVVRHYIEDQAKIPAGRVFLVQPKLNADGINDKGVPNRVDFAIR
jgi:hypothetical protein